MKDKFQSFEDGMRMARGSIQHPLSIHSASIGTCRRHRVWQVLMTLVFLFTLSIGQMWATATNFHDFVAAGDTIIDLEGSGSTPSAKFTAVNNTDWASVSTSAKNASVKRIDPSTGATATSKSNVYGTKLSSSNKTILKVQGVTGVSYYIGGGSSRQGYLNVEADGGDKWAQIESSELSTNCAVMTCTLDKDSSYTLTLSASGDIFCYAIKITVASKCNDPGTALSLSSDAAATIYVGDEITFSTTGGNGGAVTIAGAASETITANKWTATEGTHTFTASQAMNGNYCAQEDELELTVIAATPVASVTVSGPANAYKNNKVIFAATAANATQYRWTVDGVAQGSDSAKLHFTPTESKTYSIVCEAKNTYNSDWVASSAHSLTVTSLYGELIRATLTGGNNATMTGIIGGTFDSNLTGTKKKLDDGKYMGIQLSSGTFQEGDTVIVKMTTAGSNYPCLFADKDRNTLLYLATEGSSALEYKIVLPAAANNKNTVYLSRNDDDNYKWNPVVDYISVVRPMPVKSKAYDLTAVKINGTAISAANLAILKTADAYLLDLEDEYPAGPTVKFARQTANTYEDDSQKVTNDTITVTATEVSSKWQAQATIGTITYTVKMAKVSAAKVYYYDGATKLGEEIVGIGDSPVNAGNYDDKDLASFVGWYNNADLEEEHKIANIAELVVTKDTTVYGKWNPAYATSINIEKWVLDNGIENAPFRAELTARHYKYATLNNLDSLNDDPTKPYRNYAYLGQKVNKTDSEISFLLKSGSTLKVRFGHLGSNINVIYGTDDPIALTSADYANDAPGNKVYEYTATADVLVKFQCDGTSTSVFKQIMIDEPIATVVLPAIVTLNPNGGKYDDKTENTIVKYTGTPLVLGDATPADADHVFAGWYNGEDQINAAAYVPTANVELLAHYSNTEYTVTYVGGEGATGSMDPVQVAWDAEYTLATNAFAKEGHVWSGWVATYNDGVEEQTLTITEGKITMPKYNVTVTAQWTDNSKVAQIGEIKYASLDGADGAFAAVADGQTIQLLQNCEYATTWEVGANVTLDLNGKNLTYTYAGSETTLKQAIKVNAGTLTLKDGTATSPVISDMTADPLDETAVTYTGGFFDMGANWGVRVYDDAAVVVESGKYKSQEAVLNVYYSGSATVNDGLLYTVDNGVVMGNGTNGWGGYTINIHGGILVGHITSPNYASMVVYHPNFGTLNIDGGLLISTNGPAVVVRGGVSHITGGTIIAKGTGSGKCGDASLVLPAVGIAADFKSAYPGVANTDVNIGGTVDVTGQAGAVQAIYAGANPTTEEVAAIAISGGTFNTPVENEYCAPGYVPAPEVAPGVYTVMPKDGVEIIGVVTTGGTNKTVSGLYQGDASVNLDSNKKIGEGNKYIYVTLKDGYTFEENDVLVVNLEAKSDLSGGNRALEITTGVGNIDGDVWKSIAYDDYSTGDNSISLKGIAAGQTSIGLKRSANQNAKVNSVKVYRPLKPMLTAITIDGRAGVIDEANKTVAVTIPYEAELAALTVVPTIVWNEAAAENSIVVNNGAAWTLGENTYKLTDKDGDYTVYTITLTRDVLKYAVKFYDGETLLETLEVENGTSIAAGDVPADPEKEDYIFQGWAETAGSDVVDVTSFTISAAKNFYAKWAADGAIKLINKTSGAVNEDGYFITGVTATEANSEKAAVWGGTQGTNISGVNQLGKIVQYNATTNQTKLKIKVYNTNGSNKYVYIHKVVEGKTTEETVETLTATSNTVVESEYYEFNDTKNRSFYITTNSTDVKILQVKVIDDGATPMKQAGEAGYSLNLNKGRVVYYANSDVTFEGLVLNSASNYSVISSSELQTTKNISFSIASPVLLKVTTSSAKYYVSQNPDEDGTTATAVTAAGTAEFELTETTNPWYLVPSTTSNVKYTNIAFELPKCEKPVFENTLADIELCIGEAIPAIDGTATVSDGGAVTYKWYEEGSETVLATTATYTPAADGSYFVVATNSLAGHQDVSTTSDVVKVSHFASVAITTAPEDVYKHAGLDAELSVVAEGKNVTYEWFTCNDELGTNPVAIVPAETGASLNLTAIEAGIKYYQVVVTDECGTTASAVAKVEGFNDIALVDVTGDMFWDFSKANDGTAATSNLCNEAVLVNVSGIVNNSDFESDNIMATANKFSSGKLQASMIKFHTTVNGVITVVFSHTGNNKTDGRALVVNGIYQSALSHNQTAMTFSCYVPAGDVVLTATTGDGGNMLNVTSVDFKAKTTPDYSRDVTNNIGTLCVDHNVLAGGFLGATFYQILGRNQEYDYKIDFEEVMPGEELKAGEPYIFQSATGRIELFFGETSVENPVPYKGMYGNFEAGTLAITEDNAADILYIAQNKLWTCEDLVGQNLILNEHRAYIKMSAVPSQNNVVPTPGRRRITLGRNSEQVVTGFENLNAGEQAVKLIIDGKMYILRGEKMYDATGKLVK